MASFRTIIRIWKRDLSLGKEMASKKEETRPRMSLWAPPQCPPTTQDTIVQRLLSQTLTSFAL